MTVKSMLVALALLLTTLTAYAADGLQTLPSAHSVERTVERLENALRTAGFRIFARIDHAAGARSVELPLAPTQLLIFGKPKAGTLLMQQNPSVGIDLPLKYLVWQQDDQVIVGWNDPQWISARHEIALPKLTTTIGAALNKFASAAAAP